jgi:hypothetical protein
MGPGCVIPSLGLWTSISPPGVPRALVGLVFDFVAKWIQKWFCEILDDPWWFLDELW